MDNEIDCEVQVKEEVIITDYFADDKSKQEKLNIKITTVSDIKPQQKQMVNTSGKIITAKTLHNKNLNLEQFYKKSRHYFIMTDSGKPVYSRYGDEIQNCGIFGMISAMITKFTTFMTKENETPEKVNYIANENNLVVFNQKGQLYFIAMSKRNDCLSLLNSQLEYLYSQLLSILTQDRVEKLEENPSHCNTAMSNTETLFEQIIEYTSKSLVSVLDSYPVLPLEARAKLLNICDALRGEALLLIVMTQYAIVGVSKVDYISIAPSDIVLLQTLVFSSDSLRQAESWLPVCLPGISPEGYIQIYCHFTAENIGIIFVTEISNCDVFMDFNRQFLEINERMLKENLIEKILLNIPQPNHQYENSKMSDEMLLEEFIAKLENSAGSNSKISNVNINRIANVNENTNSNSNMNSIQQSKTYSPLKTNQPMQYLQSLDIKYNPFNKVIYGVCKHKQLNQYFTINFDNLQLMTKEQKHLLREYNVLTDMLNSLLEEGKANGQLHSYNLKNFFHYEQGNDYLNVIQTSETFIFIASFNFFYDYEKVNTIIKDIFKYLKLNESSLFIMIK